MGAEQDILEARNQGGMADGFSDSESLDDLFGDFGDLGGDSGNGSGDGNSSFGLDDLTGLDSSGGIFTDPNGSTGNAGVPQYGGFNNGQPSASAGGDRFDKVLDATMDGAVGTFEVIKVLVGSIGSRNADDIGSYSLNLLKTGGVFIVFSLFATIGGVLSGLGLLRFMGMPFKMLTSGILLTGTSFLGLSGAAIKLMGGKELPTFEEDAANLPDIDSNVGEASSAGSAEEEADELFGGLDFGDFGDDDEEEDSDSGFSFRDDREDPVASAHAESEGSLFDRLMRSGDSKESAGSLESVPENVPMITREFLVKTFKPFFKPNNPDFTKVRTYGSDDAKFREAETAIVSAYASAAGRDIAEIASSVYLGSFEETLYCYKFSVKRVPKVRVTESSLSDEIRAYFVNFDTAEKRDIAEITTSVTKNADMYDITVSRSAKAGVVTLGDCLEESDIYNYFVDEGHKLPIISGIDEYGVPVKSDGKIYESFLIAGKPRSGKSWTVNSLVMQLQVFNLPEDVQFLYIDPKDSYLFKCLSYMPHCCGLHNHKRAMEILDDIVNKESPRRARILQDNQCDTIWDLRAKGIKIPILYIVIDEFMTVVDYYSDRIGEFNGLVKQILTRLPSQGIRLIFVPHRAQGVVDKTIRSNLSYVAAVKADDEVVKETLDIKKWSRRLVSAGDTALKLSDKTLYVKGIAIATDDNENTKLIKEISKAFYKMRVEVPDMSTIGIGYNRDEGEIQEALRVDSGTSTSVQYDVNRVLRDLSNL